MLQCFGAADFNEASVVKTDLQGRKEKHDLVTISLFCKSSTFQNALAWSTQKESHYHRMIRCICST